MWVIQRKGDEVTRFLRSFLLGDYQSYTIDEKKMVTLTDKCPEVILTFKHIDVYG